MSEIIHPYRHCDIYISTKYKHILFVPFGHVRHGISAEHDNVISDTWPCDFGKLQENIEECLKRALVPHVEYDHFQYGRGNYPSYNHSKSKSENSFHADYVKLRVETDETRPHSKGEAERIKVTASPSPLEDTYVLTGIYHLMDTKVAQLVLDIFEACTKIRE
jgi:hypothetical protein